jgi:oligopeptide transport system substrate-binding protein
MIQDISTVYALYQKGDLHMIGSPLCGLPPEIVNELKKTNSLKSHPVDRAFWVYINTTHKHLSSPFIRRALGLAIDRSSITKHILIDGQPLTKPLPAIPLVPPFPIKEDLVQANREFEQGLEELGLTRETFPPLTLTYFPQFKLLAEYLQEAWSKTLGIKITLQGKDWNAVRDDLEKGLFEICGCVNGIISKDPLEPLEWFTNVNSNFSKWVNPLFQEKISIAKQEIDLQKRMQYLSDAEQILIDHMPFIPVSDFPMLFTHTPHLQGYILDSLANIDLSRASFKD